AWSISSSRARTSRPRCRARCAGSRTGARRSAGPASCTTTSRSPPPTEPGVTYAELLAQLIPARRFGVVFGLEPVRAILDRLGGERTSFEQITAVAMLAIADAAVDVTVLEVGLGGRLDATNVVDPAVAVVTGIALDHEAILGGTVAAIAAEKAGIWKPGRPAI